MQDLEQQQGQYLTEEVNGAFYHEKRFINSHSLLSFSSLLFSIYIHVCMFLRTYMYKIMRVKGYLCCLYHKYTDFFLFLITPPVEHRATIQRFVLSLL